MIKSLFITAAVLLSAETISYSQTVQAPNSALKSHATLDIQKISLTDEGTVIYLSVENRITGGNFCADKNICIVLPDGSRKQLLSSNGIPVCPDVYRFRSIGEKLDFVLTFPPLGQGVESFNLIEDCQQNCFSFYGVILDADLNAKIDEAFRLAEKKEEANALLSFEEIAVKGGMKNPGAAGLLYLNLVTLSASAGNKVKAAEWYHKLESSGLPETFLYLRHLNSLGIKY